MSLPSGKDKHKQVHNKCKQLENKNTVKSQVIGMMKAVRKTSQNLSEYSAKEIYLLKITTCIDEFIDVIQKYITNSNRIV